MPKDYFSTTRRSAKKRNLEFFISMEDIYNKFIEQDRKCKYSGREISFLDKTASIDRIDSKVGYITSNIQIVHKYVNLFKLSNSEEVFLNWIKTIYKFNYENEVV